MSATIFQTGKLTKISGEPEQVAKYILNSKKEDFYETFLEQLSSESDEYVLLENELYQISDTIENDDGETHFCYFYKEKNGDIRFITQFYNGGTCLSEMLEHYIDNLKKIN